MWTYNYSACLYHHGVKGMRWGIRRHRESSNSERKKMSKTKKIAIGAGITAAAVIAAYSVYQLTKSKPIAEVINDTFDLTEKAIKERDIELKGEILTVANKSASMAVKLQQIHMMRAGLLPPMSANPETQQKWEQKAIDQYEAEREKRRQARGLHS